ncbi:HAD family hydrolase [Pengzhenrongella sp.]|uniref:HAD family hydrolase n=1 Tax=Pengzhenrongella sp. TaxID=2888820 RepID=UPI002F95A14E
MSADVGTRRGNGIVDGVLFDIDDTLVDTRAAFRSALALTSAVHLPELPLERYGEVLALWRTDPSGFYRRFSSGTLGFRDQRMARANQMQETFGGAALDDAGFDAWDAAFESGFRGAWTAHDDAAPVVAELIADGIAVGALSNAPVDLQNLKLERVGLAGSVPLLVGLDTLGFGKPDPRVFAEACRLLGTEPSRTAYIGDELDIDACAARDAGLVGVWLDRPGSRRTPMTAADDAAAAGVVVVHALTDLRTALRL